MVVNFRSLLALSCLSLTALPGMAWAENKPISDDPEKIEFFEKKIRPLLVDNCYNCHSANTNAKGGLRVDDRNGLINGGSSGAAVVPGKPADSLLIQAVKHDGLEMPPKKRLSDDQIADLTKWVADGAAWPRVEITIPLGKSNEKYEKLRREHWAWQPLQDAKAPEVKNVAWARDDVDRFVLAKLEEKGLTHNCSARGLPEFESG